MAKGKAYFNRKEEKDRPLGDFYCTPVSLVEVLLNESYFDPKGNYLDPCCGTGAISGYLEKTGRSVEAYDLYMGETKKDFLDETRQFDYMVINPPFSQWDAFVEHAKKLTKRKLAVIGRLNYFACVGRSNSDIWKGLTSVLVPNRMIDFRGAQRDDGLFHVGGLVSAWFVYDKQMYSTDIVLAVLDVQPWAKLGQFKEEEK